MLSLAWSNLTHDRRKFALSVLGVGFAVVLMFVQLGFRGGLLDAQTQLPETLAADLVVLSPGRQMVGGPETFPRRRLTQAAAVPGVREAWPLFLGFAPLRDTAGDERRRSPNRLVRVIGLDPGAGLLAVPELDPGDGRFLGRRLVEPGAAIFDRRARPGKPGETVFGRLADGVTTELAGRRLTLVGGFDLGADFTSDGTLVVSTDTFADLLRRPYTPGDPLAEVDFGLVRLDPGADVAAVRAKLAAELARGEAADPDVLVLKPAELADREQAFWRGNTPIGYAFGFGLVMGVAVGLVICYQILSGDVADRLPEYATLKAIGHPNRTLAAVVFQQAVILAVAGYLVGLLVSAAAYWLLGDLTGLPLRLTPGRLAGVAAATLLMCVGSGLLAVGKLLRADPADVF